MSRSPTLTLAFLTRYPASAADVLEDLDPATGAAFLEDVPARLAATVLRHMSSWCGARTLELMEPAYAAAVLQQIPLYDGVGLLRLIPGERHSALFDELPGRRAQRLRNALMYPAGSVGAWLDPDIPAFAATTSCADAMRYLRHSEDDSHVFLHAEAGGGFLGALPVGRLLRSDPQTRLGELPFERIVPLASRASLASAAGHPDWDRYLVLPVTGRAGTMVGGLSRVSLARGLSDRRSEHGAGESSMTLELVTMFAVVCSGLVRAVTTGRSRSAGGAAERRHD